MDVLVSSLNDEEVTILHACVEVDTFAIEMLFEVLYQDVGLLRFQTSTAVILQQVALETDEVATQRQIVIGKFYADACGLQWSTTLIDKMLVIAEDAAVGDLTARMESVGDSLQHATTPITCQKVEMRRIGILQESISTQLLDRPVGHAIG